VVLPLPDGPTTATNDWGSTSKSTDFRTERGLPPLMYVFSRPWATIIMLRCLFMSVIVAIAACTPEGTTPQDTEEIPGPAVSTPEASGREDPEAGRPVVMFLGTSLTAGLGLLRDEDTYVARVAELADSASLPIRAVNAGVSGETSAGGLRRIDWVLRQPFDVLVLELGANDGLRGHDPSALESNLREIIQRTRARYPATPVLIAGMEAPPNMGALYTERFRGAFMAVAATEDAVLIPFLLEGVAGVPEFNQADGIHPTAEGHRRLARNVWPFLESVLQDLPAPTPDSSGS